MCTRHRLNTSLACLQMCHITFTEHVNYLAFMSGGRDYGGDVRGDKAAIPVTAVRACVSAFLSTTPMDIFKDTSGQFPVVSVATRYFMPEHEHSIVTREHFKIEPEVATLGNIKF